MSTEKTQPDGTPRCGSTHRGEQCLGDNEHGGKMHISENHEWPMHLPFERGEA